jgi:nucleotide-binding universal stress UspA family protein
VMIDPPTHSPERSDPGGAVCLMLARHGVKAEVSILSRTLPRVSEILTRFATEHGANLIVMGAYGHSRFRESLLGGATRDMLEGTSLPLLMAH